AAVQVLPGRRGQRTDRPTRGDEGRHRRCKRHDQRLQPQVQPRPSGANHQGTRRDRWRRRGVEMSAFTATTEVARAHLEAMYTGSKVTRWFRKDREPNVLEVTPENVIAALHEAGIKPVLMGTHGINGYRDQARATDDVDVLVTKRDVRKAIRVLD